MGILGVVLLCLLGFVALLLAVAAVRAARVKALTPAPAPGEDAGAAVRYAEGLSMLIKIPTFSATEDEASLAPFYELHRALEILFPLVHARMERTELNGNLIYRLKSAHPGREAVLLMGHQDVVPAAGEWKHPPFSGVIENGVVYGRGTLDCKCTVFAEFAAVEELLQEGFEPPCDLYLTTSVDEETSGKGARRIAEHLCAQNVRLALVLDEGGAVIDEPMTGVDRPFAMLGITEKGYADVNATAKSAGGHSSMPPRNTALVRLGRFMAEVERKSPFRRKLSREARAMLEGIAPAMRFPMRFLLSNLWLFKPLVIAVMPAVSSAAGALLSTTCAFTMAHGSDAPNVLPAEATVLANLRVSHHQNVAASVSALERIAKKHGVTLEPRNARDASAIVDISDKTYKYIENCARECFPDAGAAPYVMTGGTDARSYEGISNACIRFSPVRMTQAQLKSVHAADENISAASLAGAVRCYKRILKGVGEAL
ncbi:MAG: M20/M25/M40 family metallo-hydrolase [Clostridiaceae bacterium]